MTTVAVAGILAANVGCSYRNLQPQVLIAIYVENGLSLTNHNAIVPFPGDEYAQDLSELKSALAEKQAETGKKVKWADQLTPETFLPALSLARSRHVGILSHSYSNSGEYIWSRYTDGENGRPTVDVNTEVSRDAIMGAAKEAEEIYFATCLGSLVAGDLPGLSGYNSPSPGTSIDFHVLIPKLKEKAVEWMNEK